ncbi:MAG: hypothetical protein ACK5G7_01305 [Erysipelotrichaceae bacterium]
MLTKNETKEYLYLFETIAKVKSDAAFLLTVAPSVFFIALAFNNAIVYFLAVLLFVALLMFVYYKLKTANSLAAQYNYLYEENLEIDHQALEVVYSYEANYFLKDTNGRIMAICLFILVSFPLFIAQVFLEGNVVVLIAFAFMFLIMALALKIYLPIKSRAIRIALLLNYQNDKKGFIETKFAKFTLVFCCFFLIIFVAYGLIFNFESAWFLLALAALVYFPIFLIIKFRANQF